jgi:hypothetical protein
VRLFTVFVNLSITTLIGRYQPPWNENWELGEKFFKQMEKWEKDHPESTFAKVIENVDNVIKIGQPFLEVIPDWPFPARSVVLGLAHLLRLGAVRMILFIFKAPDTHGFMEEVASAKQEVHDFTMQLSTWFYTVEVSFRTANTKQKFTSQARKNLDAIRWVLCCAI